MQLFKLGSITIYSLWRDSHVPYLYSLGSVIIEKPATEIYMVIFQHFSLARCDGICNRRDAFRFNGDRVGAFVTNLGVNAALRGGF